jgi:vacuolar iron transporter family protein
MSPPANCSGRSGCSGWLGASSAAITLLALAAFGFVKGHFTGVPKLKGTLQAALVGSLAAGVAYLISKFIA